MLIILFFSDEETAGIHIINNRHQKEDKIKERNFKLHQKPKVANNLQIKFSHKNPQNKMTFDNSLNMKPTYQSDIKDIDTK